MTRRLTLADLPASMRVQARGQLARRTAPKVLRTPSLAGFPPDMQAQIRAQLAAECVSAAIVRADRRTVRVEPIAAQKAPECARLEIDAVAPSPNTWKGRHWRHYHRARRLWDLYVWEAMTRAGVGAHPLERVHVHIVRQSWRVCDPDNAVSCQKPVIDSLRSNGLIVDDDPSRLTLTVEQRRGKPKTIITLEAQHAR